MLRRHCKIEKYEDFRRLIENNHTSTGIGFHADEYEVLRFAKRFRVANAFRSIELEGFEDKTTDGYTALIKVFLTYSAFELFLKIMGQKQSTVQGMLAPYDPATCIDFVIKKDKDKRFYKFVHRHLDKNHQQHLAKVYGGNSPNITYVASSIRHIFAHGHLSAYANGCDSLKVKEICDRISDFHMKVMSAEFSRVVRTYQSTI